MFKILVAIVLSAAVMWFVWQQQVVNDEHLLGASVPTPDPIVAEEIMETPVAQTVPDVVETFAKTVPMQIKDVPVLASVADTERERQQGLSGTPSLPDGVVKLFVFQQDAPHGFWMKDMQYAIDIVWADRDGVIVHIEPDVQPESYPTSFKPTTSARYVVETQAGFMAANGITVGDTLTLPEGIE